MIFLIKHRWWLSLIVTLCCAGATWALGGWRDLATGRWGVQWQIALGLAGCALALAINGVLHEALKQIVGPGYVRRFQRYGRHILDGMGWPAYVAGGLMAALAEEPFFRGVLLRAFEQPLIGIAVAALAFALCHWLRLRYWGFWLWAMWEGVLFGILLVVTGSLLVVIIAHGLHDVVAYRLFARLVRDREKPHPSASAR